MLFSSVAIDLEEEESVDEYDLFFFFLSFFPFFFGSLFEDFLLSLWPEVLAGAELRADFPTVALNIVA